MVPARKPGRSSGVHALLDSRPSLARTNPLADQPDKRLSEDRARSSLGLSHRWSEFGAADLPRSGAFRGTHAPHVRPAVVMMPPPVCAMHQIVLKLPNGKTLTLSQDDARVLVARLWEIAPQPGAFPMAVKLSDAASTFAPYGRVVDVTEREYGALRLVLADPPSASA